MKQQFLELMRGPRAARMQALERAIMDALRDGETADLPQLRADFAAERDRPDAIEGETREELVAQWPAHYPPLPLWFADPSAAELQDPPGTPCKVDLSGVVLEDAAGEEEGGETVPLDLQAQILAKRAEKSIAEDQLRATGTVPVAVNTDREVSAEDLGL